MVNEDSSILHEKGNFEEGMNSLVYFTVLHGFADAGDGSFGEPVIGSPRVDPAYLVSQFRDAVTE